MFADREQWSRWLSAHGAASPGVWLKLAKKNSPTPTLSYADALEEALCFGWIDGQVGRLDEHFYRQRFTPRRPRSAWSLINRRKATELIERGRMKPAGQAQVDAAKADGRWENAYPPASEATVPADFQAALNRNPQAATFFATLTGSQRYAFLFRLHGTVRPEARAKKIAGYIERLNGGRTLN